MLTIDLVTNANDAQLAMRISAEIAAIQTRLLDVQQQALQLQADNQQLRNSIESLNDDKQFRESLDYDAAGIYRRKFQGKPDELYCSACLDSDGKRVRLSSGYGTYICHVHGGREPVD